MSDRFPTLTIARRILAEEGVWTALARGAGLVQRKLVSGGRFFIYEHDLQAWREEDFRPRVVQLEVRRVQSNAEADALPPHWDPRPFFLTGRRRLDVGATAFCLYVDGEFAHAGWTAETPEAKALVDCVPFRVDFAHGEACTGGTWTRPKFRGLGLMVYSYYLRLEHLRQRGYRRSRNAVEVDNVASQKAHARFAPRVCAVGRYVRVGRWEYWREQPLTTPSSCRKLRSR